MRAVIASALLLASTGVQADYFDGNKLHTLCAADGVGGKGMTIGYVAGVIDGAALQDSRAKVFCIPNGASLQQARDVVCQYVGRKPEKRHYNAASQAHLALAEAWPCP